MTTSPATLVGTDLDARVALHSSTTTPSVSIFGRPEGFAARQVKLWARWGHVKSRELADVDTLVAALSDQCPRSYRNTIVHGRLPRRQHHS